LQRHHVLVHGSPLDFFFRDVLHLLRSHRFHTILHNGSPVFQSPFRSSWFLAATFVTCSREVILDFLIVVIIASIIPISLVDCALCEYPFPVIANVFRRLS
jgi:hypothetical protein